MDYQPTHTHVHCIMVYRLGCMCSECIPHTLAQEEFFFFYFLNEVTLLFVRNVFMEMSIAGIPAISFQADTRLNS